jgi:hypothetical protein
MMTIAESLRVQEGRPSCTVVVSVHEGVEPAVFSAQFGDWLKLTRPPTYHRTNVTSM